MQTEGSKEQRWSEQGLRQKQLQTLLRCNKREHKNKTILWIFLFFIYIFDLKHYRKRTTCLVRRRKAWNQQIFESLYGFQRVSARANRHFLCNNREYMVVVSIFFSCFLFWILMKRVLTQRQMIRFRFQKSRRTECRRLASQCRG